jgi:superfamily I DNA/RNA helicase
MLNPRENRRCPDNSADSSIEELEEERRVFHVAVTRAKDELYLVVPQVWSTRGSKRVLMKPSRFLTEVAGLTLPVPPGGAPAPQRSGGRP